MLKFDQALRDVQHFGEEGGVVPVIDVAATSTFLDPKDMKRTFEGELEGCYLYSRHSNPTVNIFGKKLAAMEGMEAALGVASGMAAICCAVEQLMPDGGEVICSRTVYGGTYALFSNIFPKRNIHTKFVDIENLNAIEKMITPKTKVIYTETLSNPLLHSSNLKALSELCKKYNLKFVVDNTFTPALITPAQFGADVVVYSCTKYISGASDLIAGAIVGSKKFIAELIDINHGRVMLTGPVMDPRIAHELYLRLDHLSARMRAHSDAAAYFSEGLQKANIPVIYPGLSSHAHHSLMKSQLNQGHGFGGMVAVDCGTTDSAMKLAANLQSAKFGLYAVSLGFSRTLISVPSVTTSSEIPAEEQKLMKLSPGLLRLSIGYVGDPKTMLGRFLTCYEQTMEVRS